MSVIVTLILALLPALMQWLVDLLNQHAGDATATGDDAADAEGLLLVCLRSLPPTAVCKRAVVRILLAHVPPAIRAGEKVLPGDTMTELNVLQGLIAARG